jgi:hypothetical protein
MLAFISSSRWKYLYFLPEAPELKLLGITSSLNAGWARHFQQYMGKLVAAFWDREGFLFLYSKITGKSECIPLLHNDKAPKGSRGVPVAANMWFG